MTLSGGLADIPTLVISYRAFAVGSALCWQGVGLLGPLRATKIAFKMNDGKHWKRNRQRKRDHSVPLPISASYRCAFLRAKGIFSLKRLLPPVELAMAQKLSRVAKFFMWLGELNGSHSSQRYVEL